MTTKPLRRRLAGAALALTVGVAAACTAPAPDAAPDPAPDVESPSTTPATTTPAATTPAATTPVPPTPVAGGPPGGPAVPCRAPRVTGGFPAGVTCRNLTVDGYTREYLVYVPASVAASHTAIPLVIMFHGSGGTGAKFLAISGWKEKAEAEGFIAAFPTGLEYFVTDDGKHHWSTKWASNSLASDIDVSRRLQGYPTGSPWPADDVGFTGRIIDDVAAHEQLDPTRVFVSGFSNGGGFGTRLAAELSTRIAAVATSGAPSVLGQVPTATTPAPMWQMLGTKDARIAQKMGVSEFPMDPAQIIAMPKLGGMLGLDRLAYGLPSTPCETTTSASRTDVRWCAAGRPEFRFTMVRDMTHVYPRGLNPTSNPSGVSAADLFWDFFRTHPRV